MSLESGRKLGLIASLISVILPVVSIVGSVAFFIALIATAATRIGSGNIQPFLGLPVGFIIFLVLIGAVGIAGFVLFIIAMHRLSNYYKEPSIFKNVFYAFILNIISGIMVIVFQFVFLASSLSRIPQIGSTPNFGAFFSQFIFPFLVVIGVAVVFAIVNAVLYMRAFNKLAEKSGVDNFRTTGLLYLLGTILSIVLIGGLLVWIAWIFAAMGFHKLKPTLAAPTTAAYPPQPSSTVVQTKRCVYCGTDNNIDATYCKSCGKVLQ